MNVLYHILDSFTTLIGGYRCEICNHPLPYGRLALCTGCLLQIPRTLIHRSQPNLLSELLANAVAPVHFAGAWFFYDPRSPWADLVRVGKYYNRPGYLRELGRFYAIELMADVPDAIEAIDVLLPIPMHPRKEFKRGYNQAYELALGISDVTGIPIGDNLRMIREKDTQTHRGVEERHANVKGIFTTDHPDELQGLNVMLVDDVITTGSTISEAALSIGRSGARPATLSILALAMRH